MKPANALLSGHRHDRLHRHVGARRPQHGAINLGQGFPDTDGPADVLQAAADALHDGRNQYPPMTGVPELREAVAAANRRFYGLEVDPTTRGGRHLRRHRGDHRLPDGAARPRRRGRAASSRSTTPTCRSIRMLGAVPRLVRLPPPKWELPRAELAAAFGPRTKAILLNTPMNPTGKVFTAAELAFIADLLAKHDCLRGLRRGLRAPDLRRLAAHPADDAAGHARALHAGRQRRQDVQPDRLEGRLRHRAGGAGRRSWPRRTRTSPSPRRPTCSGRWRSGWPRTTPISPGLRAGLAAKRDRLSAGLAAARLRRAAGDGQLLRHRRFLPARLRRRRRRVLPPHHRSRPASPPSRSAAFYEQRAADPLRPLRLLQARRGAGRGVGPARRLGGGARRAPRRWLERAERGSGGARPRRVRGPPGPRSASCVARGHEPAPAQAAPHPGEAAADLLDADRSRPRPRPRRPVRQPGARRRPRHQPPASTTARSTTARLPPRSSPAARRARPPTGRRGSPPMSAAPTRRDRTRAMHRARRSG